MSRKTHKSNKNKASILRSQFGLNINTRPNPNKKYFYTPTKKAYNFTYLMKLIFYNDTQKIIEILEKEPEMVSQKNSDGWNVLHIIARNSRIVDKKIMKIILESKINIDEPSDFGRTALHIAAYYSGKESCRYFVKLLIQYGCNLNLTDNNNNTALNLMCFSIGNLSDWRCIKDLINAGADVNVLDSCNLNCLSNVLRFIVRNINSDIAMKIVKKISEKYVFLSSSNITDPDYQQFNSIAILFYLLHDCVAIHYKKQLCDTHTNTDIDTDHYHDILIFLMKRGADIHFIDSNCGSLLALACRNNCTKCVKILFDAGCRIGDSEIENIIDDIFEKSKFEILQILLQYLDFNTVYFGDRILSFEIIDRCINKSNFQMLKTFIIFGVKKMKNIDFIFDEYNRSLLNYLIDIEITQASQIIDIINSLFLKEDIICNNVDSETLFNLFMIFYNPEYDPQMKILNNILKNDTLNFNSFDTQGSYFHKIIEKYSGKNLYEIIKLVLESGKFKNINSLDAYGDSIFMKFMMQCFGYPYFLETLKLFLQYGADPNIKNNNKMTALHNMCHPLKSPFQIYKASTDEEAVYNNVISAIKLLFEYGADPNIVDENYNNALQILLSMNYKIFYDFEYRDADSDCIFDAEQIYTIACILINHDIDLLNKNKKGLTAQNIFMRNYNSNCIAHGKILELLEDAVSNHIIMNANKKINKRRLQKIKSEYMKIRYPIDSVSGRILTLSFYSKIKSQDEIFELIDDGIKEYLNINSIHDIKYVYDFVNLYF